MRIPSRTWIVVGVIGLAVIGYVGYKKIFPASSGTRYVLATATKGTLVSAVAGSGQVSAENTLDVTPKVSGEILYLKIVKGQEVKAGDVLAQLDNRDALKTVRDAETNLESARISLEKLVAPADALAVLQSEHSLAAARESKLNAEEAIRKAYEDGFTNVADAFLDLPPVMSGLQGILMGTTLNSSQPNAYYYADAVKDYDATAPSVRDKAIASYQAARAAYDKNFSDYKSASRQSDNNSVDALIDETYATTELIAESVKDANNLIQFYKDKLIARGIAPKALADTHLASLNTYTGQTNGHLSALLASGTAIENGEQAAITAERNIAEKTASLENLKAGADALDIRSQQLQITQRKNTLADAREKLADYTVRAPFGGVVASVGVEKGDQASANTVIATLIAKERIAEITLNEVDAAKIAVGQKATLTFDAVEGLQSAGTVADIDVLGTVSQGVVSYAVKITFDVGDERIKPGMSAGTSIITDVKQDVLMVPGSAVKSDEQGSYVEVPDETAERSGVYDTSSANVTLMAALKKISVETGLANDTDVEIVRGLAEGDRVIVRAATATSQTGSQRGLYGVPGGGGIRVR